VYIIRIYILAVVVVILFGAPLLTAVTIISNVFHQVSLRRATSLTIANAVHGPWWDNLLWGDCTLSPAELREKHKTSVTFGVDVCHRGMWD